MSAAPSVDLVIAHVVLLRLICALPLFHLHGLGVAVHATFTAGGAIRILPEFDPAEVATAIAVGRATLVGRPDRKWGETVVAFVVAAGAPGPVGQGPP